MEFRKLVRRLIESTGYTIRRLPGYAQDGLLCYHNHEFMDDPSFRKAYQRGVWGDSDHNWHWRVHIGLWVAYCASKLDGDFVECGVNRGFMSSAIMEYLEWDSLGKTFYLLDTFAGLDKRYGSEQELKANARGLMSGHYVRGLGTVRANFSEWKNVRIIPGAVPDTLSAVDTQRIAYVHLDMACVFPEVAAFNALWERLVPGAFILLGSYAYQGFRTNKAAFDAAAGDAYPGHTAHKLALDAAAGAKGVRIASLPTGQGLLIKGYEAVR